VEQALPVARHNTQVAHAMREVGARPSRVWCVVPGPGMLRHGSPGTAPQ
jgi:hypothetical protein